MNIFERATRDKFRFETEIGSLLTEHLWDLPLTATRDGRPDLDKTARRVAQELKGLEETSFVQTESNPRKAELEVMLEVVKHIIAVKLEEKASAKAAVEKAERKRKLLSVLASKEEQELQGKSREELEAEIAAL